MSIRQSPQLTPQLLDAARSNARCSTGPRSEAGKHHSRMNAVKHGERADPENRYDVMRALGEDPAQSEALKQEFLASYGSGDPLMEKQVDDLAYLYVRRERVERAQTGLMRRALLEVEEKQYRRRIEIAGATVKVSRADNLTLGEPADPAARQRLLGSVLGVIRQQVQDRCFRTWQARELGHLYGEQSGWRAARLCSLLEFFAAKSCREWHDDQGGRLVGAFTQADEAEHQELLELLEGEIAVAAEEFEHEEKLNEEKVAIERDACLAPAGEEWRMLLRREESLDRAIDRKIKLLLTLRKSSTGTPACAEENIAGGQDVGAPLVGAQPDGRGGSRTAPTGVFDGEGGHEDRPDGDVNEEPTPINDEPSPLASGCQAPAVSSAGA